MITNKIDDINLEEKLKVYNVLANNLRLHILYLLYKNGQESYKDILKNLRARDKKREMNIAYHLSILRSSNFITIDYIRNGRNLSIYKLTDYALSIIDNEKLFSSLN